MHYFVGGLHLSQQKYNLDLLKHTKMDGSKPLATPIASNNKFCIQDGILMDDLIIYRQTVGALQYVTITQLDISFAVNNAAQLMQHRTDQHWALIKRILRYIKNTLQHCMVMTRSSSCQLAAFSYADWIGCPNDRKSHGG